MSNTAYKIGGGKFRENDSNFDIVHLKHMTNKITKSLSVP